MQVSTKFTIAVHLLIATEYFHNQEKITSGLLASSIGSNPVIIRNCMSQLQHAGLIEVKHGTGGVTLTRPLSNITFLDIYDAVETTGVNRLFHFHSNPNPACPVGHNIHAALDTTLTDIQDSFRSDLARHNVGEVYTRMLTAIKAQGNTQAAAE